MTPDIKPLAAGNWKMNGVQDSLHELKAIAKGIDSNLQSKIDVLVCVPATLISRAVDTGAGSPVQIGGQDCHPERSGAHTGDISAEMIRDCGATTVIVGHSERRTDHGETSALVRTKAEAVLREGLGVIVCIGETEEQRKNGTTLNVLKKQLEGSLPEQINSQSVTVAYEPVWAIGTGLTPTAEDIAEVHAFVRQYLRDTYRQEGAKTRILYGGSVKPGNARELMAIANVDGALVGGASLNAEDFLGICDAYRELA